MSQHIREFEIMRYFSDSSVPESVRYDSVNLVAEPIAYSFFILQAAEIFLSLLRLYFLNKHFTCEIILVDKE